MNKIAKVFSYGVKQIRTVKSDNENWFVAKDVCDVLEIANTTQAVQKLDSDERSMLNIDRQGRTNVVNEFGLYNLILGSRKPEAKHFKRWVTHEVLPAIRKTGRFDSVVTGKTEITSLPTVTFKNWKGQPVILTRDLAPLLRTSVDLLHRCFKKAGLTYYDFEILKERELRRFKEENQMVSDSANSLTILYESGFTKLQRYFGTEMKPANPASMGPAIKKTQTVYDVRNNTEAQNRIERMERAIITLQEIVKMYNGLPTPEDYLSYTTLISKMGTEIFVNLYKLTQLEPNTVEIQA